MPVTNRTSKLKPTDVFSQFNPADCFLCGKPMERRQKLVEVKTRLKNEWYKAHIDCARDAKGEHYLLTPRRIRCINNPKQMIKPRKQPPYHWRIKYSPLEVERS